MERTGRGRKEGPGTRGLFLENNLSLSSTSQMDWSPCGRVTTQKQESLWSGPSGRGKRTEFSRGDTWRGDLGIPSTVGTEMRKEDMDNILLLFHYR